MTVELDRRYTLDNDLAQALSAELRNFIEKITPIVDKFEGERNIQESIL